MYMSEKAAILYYYQDLCVKANILEYSSSKSHCANFLISELFIIRNQSKHRDIVLFLQISLMPYLKCLNCPKTIYFNWFEFKALKKKYLLHIKSNAFMFMNPFKRS